MRELSGSAAERLEALLLLAAPTTLLVPPPLRAPALAAWALAWWTLSRPPRRERWVAGFALAIAVTCSALLAWPALERRLAPTDRLSPELRADYRAAWRPLQEGARTAAQLLGPASDDPEYLRRAFERLEALAVAADEPIHLRLVDPDGVPRAWAGTGMVHEPEAARLPLDGTAVDASFSAVSFLAAAPLDAAREGATTPPARAWRVILGRSFALDPPAFLPSSQRLGQSFRITFLSAGGSPEPLWTIAEPGLPTLLLRPTRSSVPVAPVESWESLERAAAWSLAAALLAVAVLRGIGRLLLQGTILAEARSWRVSAAAAVAAMLAWAIGIPGALTLVAALAVGALLVVAAARAPWAGNLVLGSDLLAALGPVAGFTVATVLERVAGPGPSAEEGWLSAAGVAWLLTPTLLVGAALVFAARIGAESRGRHRKLGALAGFALLAASSVLVDEAGWSILALGLAASSWRRPIAAWLRAGGLRLAVVALACAVLGSAAGETASRWRLRANLAAALASVTPPQAPTLTALGERLEAHFDGLEIDELLVRPANEVDRIDLAYSLWRRSPLARADAVSALTIEIPGERPSIFAFGLPMTASGELDREPARWADLAMVGPASSLVDGKAWIELRGRPWALARFWILPRPGFSLRPAPLEDLAAVFLRGGPTIGSRALPGAPAEVRLVLFSPEGRALVSPWREAPPRLVPFAAPGPLPIVLPTPEGRAWGLAQRDAWGFSTLLVERLVWSSALEKDLTRTLGLAAWLVALLAAASLLALPRAAARDMAVRAVRSYSRRLLLLFTGLVLVPSVALYAFLTGALGRRLELQQRADGEAALNSAQRVLGEYLATLDPGFGLDTALDDTLLSWLSRVVQHDVSLYWGGEVYASSRRELFTSGFLPRRIPGEVQARLALFGDELASRDSRAGEATYLELFAPLRVPGASSERGRLFLSMPLLAQQEELGAELARLRRRALLVASALFAGLSVVGIRLARNFTRPLAELVESTRRIAAGEPALALQPKELELAALVEAVERMARRIAEGRERLTREKQLIERIVENVTSGVVSADELGRVQLANRAARRLLGVEPGVDLRSALAAQPALAQVAADLDRSGHEPAQWTVRFAGPPAEEREWAVVWIRVPGDGEVTSLLIVEDATEVLRGQRLAAWAEMARIIAHEIKNPLTPIRLSTEFLREVWQRDRERFAEVFERCTANILHQVDELRDIAGDFATYSRLPRLERVEGDLVEMVRELVDGYSTSTASTAGVRLVAPVELRARFDAKLLGRAIRNLVENSLRASRHGQEVMVTLEQDAGQVRIEVADCGPGVPDDQLSRIFEPYFSTHAGGTGLGLPIARRIAIEHGGTLFAHNRPGGGLAAVITIPPS